MAEQNSFGKRRGPEMEKKKPTEIDGKKEKDGVSLWLGPNLSQRWGELLAYPPFWVVLCLCVVVPIQFYEGLASMIRVM